MSIGIYKITSPKGRIYIGQSKNLENRLKSYYCKGQIRVEKSFKKHGRENHMFEILKVCEVKELDHYECLYIKEYDTFDTEHGLNLRSGGNVAKHSAESNEKNRQAHLGKKASLETRLLLSKLKTGKPVPKQVGINISKAKKGKPFSEAHKAALSLARKNSPIFQARLKKLNDSKGRPVINTITGQTYKSAKLAAEAEGYLKDSLTPMLNGHQNNRTHLKYL